MRFGPEIPLAPGPGNPAWLTIIGEVVMGEAARVPLVPGQVMRIATGGMLPPGADAVVMLEYTQELADQTLEVYRSAAPGRKCGAAGGGRPGRNHCCCPPADACAPRTWVCWRLWEFRTVSVRRRPRIAIIGTGDEIVPVTVSLAAWSDAGCQLLCLGRCRWLQWVVNPHFWAWSRIVWKIWWHRLAAGAAESADVILLSGGSSVGARDLAIAALQSFPDAAILVHGVARQSRQAHDSRQN